MKTSQLRYTPANVPAAWTVGDVHEAERRILADRAAILERTDRWAADHGFQKVPAEQQGRMRLQPFSTGTSTDRQVVYYEETHTQAAKAPIEVLVETRPRAGGPTVQILIDDGMGRAPSATTQAMYKSLCADLKFRYGDRIASEIW